MSGPRAAGANDPNIPRRKEISSRDVFVWMGHGNEVPIEFHERRTVPDGKIIVLLAEYGKPVKASRAEDIWKDMATNPEAFRDPGSEAAKALLKDTVHVYYPGDKIPKFLYYPFLVQQESRKWTAYPSGVYKMDMEKKSGFSLPANESGTWKKQNVSDGPIPWNTIFSGDENKMFLENVKAKNSVIAAASMYHRKELLEKVFVRDSDELLDELPAGIHYFMSCRLIKGQAAKVFQFLNKLKEDIEFLIQYYTFTRNGYNFHSYNEQREYFETKMKNEIYNGPLHKLLIRTFFAEEEDIPTNANEDYFIEDFILFGGSFEREGRLYDVLRCIAAAQRQSAIFGPFTGEEYIEKFTTELHDFKNHRKNAQSKLFFQQFDIVLKEGLKDILEPAERRRRNSLAQQQKAGRRTRKLKKKSKSKTR